MHNEFINLYNKLGEHRAQHQYVLLSNEFNTMPRTNYTAAILKKKKRKEKIFLKTKVSCITKKIEIEKL